MKNILIALSSLFILASCRVEGPPGPPGPQGNANVFAYEYEVLPSAWTPVGNIGDPNYGYVAPAAFPELTQNLLSNGAVVGYYIQADGGQVPMPALLYNNGYASNYDFILYPGEVEFWIRESDLMTEAPANVSVYRMVVIGGSFKTLPDLQSMTIEEIEAYFGITEYKKIQVGK